MSEHHQLKGLREAIDALDSEMVAQINRRLQLAQQIGEAKRLAGKPVYDPAREKRVFERLLALNTGPLPQDCLERIFREIISASTALQRPISVAYLGPEGTFTQQAALRHFGGGVELLPLPSIPEVFGAVERGQAHYGVVPVENSSQGTVFATLDALSETPLQIIGERYLPIEHCLISRSPLAGIRKVYSKDQALGQCRLWLAANLPRAELGETSSTARAVEIVADEPGSAAIASSLAATQFGLPVLVAGIQDLANNHTRFLVVGPAEMAPGASGQDKTSIIMAVRDEVGALMHALEPFRQSAINITRIESRPSRRRPWDYVFFVDFSGHHDDPMVGEVISHLRKSCPMVKFLGSYPDDDPGQPSS